MENHWQIQEHTFTSDIKQIRSQETVFTIGNGYFCTRGSFEEGYPHATPATLLYGIFDDIPISKEELANTPDWLTIQLFVNGERFPHGQGPNFSLQAHIGYEDSGSCSTVRWKGDNGVVVRIQSERFASLADQHVGIIHYNVMVEESPRQQAVHIQLRAGLNTAQSNQDVMHWETLDQGHQQDRLWLLSETRHSAVRLAQVVSLRTDTPEVQKEIIDSDIDPSIHLSTTLTPGKTLNTEKILVMYTSRDESEPLVHALTHHERLRSANIRQGASSSPLIYDALFAQHKKVWHDFWQEADIVLEGDIKAQLGLRYSSTSCASMLPTTMIAIASPLKVSPVAVITGISSMILRSLCYPSLPMSFPPSHGTCYSIVTTSFQPHAKRPKQTGITALSIPGRVHWTVKRQLPPR